MQAMGRAVTCTGGGLDDSDALSMADVGVAMGSGCEVAQDSADLVLVDDNFASLMSTLAWGRTIYANVRKFLQFQLTCNFATILVTLLGLSLNCTPILNVPQLLWVNLIMDTLAAIALISEPASSSILQQYPVFKSEFVITGAMWRQIFFNTVYMVAVITVNLLLAPKWWGLKFQDDTMMYDLDGNPTDKCIHYTMLFNTFIWMLIFNEASCRRVGVQQFNLFQRAFKNWIFLAVVALICGVQVAMVQKLGIIMMTAPLTGQQFASCVLWGAGIWVWDYVPGVFGDKFAKVFAIEMNEKKTTGVENDPLLKAY